VSGLVFTASTLSWTGGSWILAQRIERYGPRRFLALGFAVVVAGIAGFAAILIPSVPLIVAVVTWSVAGLGMGLSYSTPAIIVLRDAPAELQGASTAGLQLSDVLGTSLGTGLGGAFIAGAARSGSQGWVGLALTFAVSIAVAVVGLTLSPRVRRRGGVPAPERAIGAA
jgi:MFS family permease